jgi:hypothetical protein
VSAAMNTFYENLLLRKNMNETVDKDEILKVDYRDHPEKARKDSHKKTGKFFMRYCDD